MVKSLGVSGILLCCVPVAEVRCKQLNDLTAKIALFDRCCLCRPGEFLYDVGLLWRLYAFLRECVPQVIMAADGISAQVLGQGALFIIEQRLPYLVQRGRLTIEDTTRSKS